MVSTHRGMRRAACGVSKVRLKDAPLVTSVRTGEDDGCGHTLICKRSGAGRGS